MAERRRGATEPAKGVRAKFLEERVWV